MPTVSETSLDSVDLQQMADMLRRLVSGVWRYRWAALIVAWVISVAAWLGVYLLPDTFAATARVFVDKESVLKPLLRGLSVEADVSNDVAIMTQALVSRPNLERVARETDLDIETTTTLDYEAMLRSLEERIVISRDREEIYEISFSDSSRERAVAMVDTLLDTFVEDTLGTGQEDSAQAERALRAEIADYESRLVESEDRLKEFKRKNVGMMPSERGDYYGQLQAANADLGAAQQALKIGEQRLTALRRQLEGEEPLFGIMNGTFGGGMGRSTSVDGQIQALERKLADLQVEFTEKHPEVVRAKSLLADLIAKRDAERATSLPLDELDPVTSMLDLNPVYQNIRIQVSDAEVELETLREGVVDKRARVEQLKKMVDVIPQVEAELNRLNRDYEVVRTRHAEMLRRWEDLQTATRVGAGADQVKFRIIDPPFAALKPVGPPRQLYVIVSFVLALGAGVALALAISLLRPVYSNTRDLQLFGLPILGSIAARREADDQAASRRQNLRLAGLTATLLISVVGAVAFANVGSAMLRTLVSSI